MSIKASPSFLDNKEQIVTAYKLQDIQEVLSLIPKGAAIFIDVDDTLITFKSNIFRSNSSYRDLISQIKEDRDKLPNFEAIISHWRLQRKIILVSDEWPQFIDFLKKTFAVYGLTKMETGRVGAIPSMEKWRFEELKSKEIFFTPLYKESGEEILIKEPSKPYPACFYQGIFVTGSYNKSDVMRVFLSSQKPTKIIFIDDRQEMLEDVCGECNRQSILFLGILFKGAELIPGEPHPKIAEVQKQYLLEHAKWLEDEEAEKFISKDMNSSR